ncbi:hypothetical protein QP028_04655 [Corynebacterium suedekumii]|nr:hypothetical protein QP028_04655 [Corynebacterium suedekumii]
MIVLGIETSCDETGVGVVDLAEDGTLTVLADSVASSMQQHARFGGVVPEIASRAHLEEMGPVMRAALAEAGVSRPDAVAATVGPGLAGALLVGASAAKAYAAAWGVPLLRGQPPRRARRGGQPRGPDAAARRRPARLRRAHPAARGGRGRPPHAGTGLHARRRRR